MNTTLKNSLAGLILIAGSLASASALAWHGGVYVGVPFPFAYPYPYYSYPYYPSVVTVPAQPQVYVEQAPAAQAATGPAQAGNLWYYCAKSQAYYPYVKECPSGWQPVSPTPPQ